MYIENTLWSGCALQLHTNNLVFPSLAPLAAFLPSSSATAVAPETHALYISRPASFHSPAAYSVYSIYAPTSRFLWKSCILSVPSLLKGCILIGDLMWFSDLENLLSIGRIFYQLGESYLNLFLLHKVENLWSVRNLWSIFTSLSALEDFLSDLGEGERGGKRALTPI